MPDMTTVGELIDYLATQPRDRLVVMASDPEGNSYGPLADAETALYDTQEGQTYLTDDELDARIRNRTGGWTDEDRAPAGAKTVVVLGPGNPGWDDES